MVERLDLNFFANYGTLAGNARDKGHGHRGAPRLKRYRLGRLVLTTMYVLASDCDIIYVERLILADLR